ncbi:M15 family metallopeptidase [Arthrobacter sp. AQ5-05]|uniref:M15 family metallopeptidase n=1 Tax=Arthrobacter sp. AQ5-05 TaxID=2184581 RepID=UPI0011BFAFAC|nr:M15 family metallopeptidase [Arthrobacter sp. AQ5-05]
MSLFRAGIPALLLGASLVLAVPLAAQAAPAAPAAAQVHVEKQPKPPTTKELTKDQGSYLALVSRDHPLDPVNYKPKDLRGVAGSGHELRKDAATALETMLKAARKDSQSLAVLSAYRSYDRQLSLFNGYKARYGTDYATRLSAPAGTSEHQIGLAADIGLSSGYCNLKACFGDTAGGKWLAANAADFGFIVRYPADGEKVTGYKYEPWHLRYIGVDQAKAMAKSKAGTFEAFHASLVKASKVKPRTAAEIKKQRESLLVLRFLPPYRDWSIGYDFAR